MPKEKRVVAIITEDVEYETSFKLQDDLTVLANRIEAASNMSSRRYVFVGESHDFAVDIERRNTTFQRFISNKGIVVVGERAMKGERDIPLSGFIPEGRAGAILETDYTSGSADPVRNTQVVAKIVKEIANDPSYRQREVLIFFGQEHEKGIREELKKQLGAEDKICWWSFPSILDQLYKLPDPVYPNQNGYTFVGFTDLPSLSDPKPHKLLLTKGRHIDPFVIEVKAPYNSGNRLPKVGLYALYGSNRFPGTKHHIAAMEKKGGACSFNVFAPDIARLVPVATDDEYQQLKNG
jgi:hypothetical protein